MSEVEKFLKSEVDISGLSDSELDDLQNAVAFINAFGECIKRKG